MDAINSKAINDFETGQICTLYLKFTSYAEYNNHSAFSMNCKTSDGLNVVCFGKLDLKTAELSNLMKNDVLQLKNVKCERNFREYGVHYNFKIDFESEISSLSNDGNLRQILQKSKTLKRTPSMQSMKSVKFFEPNNIPAENYDDIKNMTVGEKCSLTLTVTSYIPNNNCHLIYINCKTSDNIPVVVAASIYFHAEPLKKNDTVQFNNVMRNKLKSGKFGLRFDEGSRALLYYRDGHNYDPPIEILNGKAPENVINTVRSPLRNASEVSMKKYNNDSQNVQNHQSTVPDYKIIPEKKLSLPKNESSIKNEKVTGTLMTDFEDGKYSGGLIYRADMLLDDSSKIKLLIAVEFAKWPYFLLKKGHRLSVGGKKILYYGREARLVSEGDAFDFDESPPIAFPSSSSWQQAAFS